MRYTVIVAFGLVAALGCGNPRPPLSRDTAEKLLEERLMSYFKVLTQSEFLSEWEGGQPTPDTHMINTPVEITAISSSDEPLKKVLFTVRHAKLEGVSAEKVSGAAYFRHYDDGWRLEKASAIAWGKAQ